MAIWKRSWKKIAWNKNFKFLFIAELLSCSLLNIKVNRLHTHTHRFPEGVTASTHWYSSSLSTLMHHQLPTLEDPSTSTHEILCQIKRHFLASNEWQTLDGGQILFINVTNHIYLLLHFPKLFSNLGTCCLHLNLALVSPCWKLLPCVLPYSFFWQK